MNQHSSKYGTLKCLSLQLYINYIVNIYCHTHDTTLGLFNHWSKISISSVGIQSLHITTFIYTWFEP